MENSKGKKVVLLLIILVFVILLVAGGAYAYIATDLLKTPDMLFKKYMLNEAVELLNFNVGPYKEAVQRMKNEKTEIKVAGKNEYDLGFNQRLDEDDEEKAYLESTLTLKLDNPNKNQALSLSAKLDGEEYFDFELLKSKDAAGIYVEGLHDKYITVENRDLKKIAKTFEVEEDIIAKIPDKLPELSISNDEKDKMVKVIYDIISDELKTIDSNSYTQEKYVIDDYEGEKFEGNKYTLTISAKKLQEVITNIITNIVQNEEINKILKSKLSEGYIDNLKEEILDELEIENTASEETIVKLSVYSYNGKTLKFDIVTDDEMVFEMYMVNKEKSSSIQIKIIDVSHLELRPVDMECLINIKSSFENNNGEMSYEQKITYDKDDVKKFKAKQKDENPFYDEDEFDEMFKSSTTSAKAVTTYENNKIETKITLISEDNDKQTATYTVKFGDVKVPTLESNKIIVINDYTQDDFSELGMEIFTNGAKTAEEKPNTLIGSMFGFVNSFGPSSKHNNSILGDNESYENEINDFEDEEEVDDDSTTNSGTITFHDIDSNQELSLTEINQAKGKIYTAVGNAISSLLRDYRNDLEDDPNANLGDYLGEDKIQNEAGTSIKNLQIMDGETLKCEYEGNTYFVKIYINGDTLRLDDVDVLYSEDGTLENAR